MNSKIFKLIKAPIIELRNDKEYNPFIMRRRPTPCTSELVPFYWQPLVSDVVLRYLNIDEELRMEKALNIEQRYSFKKNVRHTY